MMKKILFRTISCFMVFSFVFLMCVSSSAKNVIIEDKNYKTNDVVEFGSYPQSKVNDTVKLFFLSMKIKKWTSYDYYSGSNLSPGTMKQSDYMKYADFTFAGQKYRAVKFSSYRPYWTYYSPEDKYSYQDDNGYKKNMVYYFKYETLKWRILDPSTGYMMCEQIIDAQPYSNTVYYHSTGELSSEAFVEQDESKANHYTCLYSSSSIRQWLNNDFFNDAFTDEKNEIALTQLDNRAYSSVFKKYNSPSTNDKIFLPSYNDMINEKYGFSSDPLEKDEQRCSSASDYSKCQGLWVHSSVSDKTGYYIWRLRNASFSSTDTWGVSFSGELANNICHTASCSVGIRPAMRTFKFRNIQNNALNRIDGTWYYIVDGKVNYDFKGLVKNEYGWWYVQKGEIDFSYNGKASNQYGTWNVVNGKVTTKA